MNNFIQTTAIETHKLVERATDSTGRTLEAIAEIPLVQSIQNFFGGDWLMGLLGEVDIDKIEAKVSKLQQEYPLEKSREIARRLIVDKAEEAGKIGLVTNILPPVAATLLGIELAAITKLQAEMIYEIAAAYGLDLTQPNRRGEILAIFSLSLGSSFLKSSLNFIEILPGIGAIVGASTNALIFYSLGYTASRFYEIQYEPFSNWKQEIEIDKDWQSAYAESQIVDLALVHIILAGFPDKSWSDILPVLQKISPSSVKTVAINLDNPQPLELLLEQLAPNYALLLLTRCYAIAQWDGVVTPEEQKVIDKIVHKFDIDPCIISKYSNL